MHRRLTGSTVLRTIGASLVGQLATAVSGVCSARALGVENRGHLALIVLVPLILVLLGGMGVPTAVTFVVARAGSVQALPRKVVALALAQAIAVLVASVLVIVLLVADDASIGAAAALTLPAAPAWLIMQYGLGVLQGQSRFSAFNLLRAAPAVLYAVVSVVLFATGASSLAAFAFLWSLTWPTSALATWLVVRRVPGRPAAEESVRGLVRFGLRALPGVSSPLETFRLDQVAVGVLLSPFDLGLYVVAVSFTVLPRLLALSIGAVTYPSLAGMAESTTSARALARQAVLLTIVLCSGVVVPLFVFAPELLAVLFGEEFSGAAVTTQILLVGALFASVRRIVGDVVLGLGRPAVASLGEVAAWVSAIPLVALLLPYHGLEGVALALTAAAGVSLVVVVAAARWTAS